MKLMAAIARDGRGGYLLFDYVKRRENTLDWKTVLKAVIEAAISGLPEPWKSLALMVWAYIKNLIPEGEVMSVSAAPEEFRTAVKEKLLALVAMINRPIIRRLATRFVNNLTDDLLNAAWDRLFGTGAPPLMADMSDMTTVEYLAAMND